jgi:outer membrane lipoprotein-sorting protein
MFLLLNTKTIRFIISSFVFFACLTPALAQEEFLPVLPKNAVDAERDFDMILLGMRNYDIAVQSGEGECLYVYRQPGMPDAYSTWKAHLAFSQGHTRIEFEDGFSNNKHTPRATIILNPSGTLEIISPETGKSEYHFSTETSLETSRNWVDPRRWFHITDRQDLPTYLKERNFRILKSEFFNGFPCYVLEAKHPDQQGDSFERIWVSPELGLRYLQYESRFLREADSRDGLMKKGTPSVRRVRLSYELHGEDAWFITNGISETLWIDSDGAEHLISRAIIETQNFRVNHDPLPEIFTVDIPNDARIQVEELGKKLSKKEFRQWYGEIHLKGIKLIKDR